MKTGDVKIIRSSKVKKKLFVKGGYNFSEHKKLRIIILHLKNIGKMSYFFSIKKLYNK